MNSDEQEQLKTKLEQLKGELELIEQHKGFWKLSVIPEAEAVRKFGTWIEGSEQVTLGITEISAKEKRRKQIALHIAEIEQQLGVTPGLKVGDVATFTYKEVPYLGFRITHIDGDRVTVVDPDGTRSFVHRSEMNVHSINGSKWV